MNLLTVDDVCERHLVGGAPGAEIKKPNKSSSILSNSHEQDRNIGSAHYSFIPGEAFLSCVHIPHTLIN